MEHILKIHPKYYCRVANGTKTFEVRKDDRGFQPGDVVVLKEWCPDTVVIDPKNFEVKHVGEFTGSPDLTFDVGYVLRIDNDRVVFSLLPKANHD